MVLSYAAWRRQFGGDPAAIGRTLIVQYTQLPVRIVGVAPPGFEYPNGVDAWVQILPDFTAQVDIPAGATRGESTVWLARLLICGWILSRTPSNRSERVSRIGNQGDSPSLRHAISTPPTPDLG
jgi:hypothetical protein